ncbi:MAG: hypothetical protein IRZ09_07240 [Variibacter sp.]|nr:hypothetical protein [Variibacter sp.]
MSRIRAVLYATFFRPRGDSVCCKDRFRQGTALRTASRDARADEPLGCNGPSESIVHVDMGNFA